MADLGSDLINDTAVDTGYLMRYTKNNIGLGKGETI